MTPTPDISANDQAEAHFASGSTLYLQGAYSEAEREFREAIELNPSEVTYHVACGDSLYAQQKFDDAVKEYKRALKLNPRSADAYSGWGNTFLDRQRYAAAIRKYRKAIKIDSNHVAAYNNWGLALATQGNHSEAIQRYKEALKLNDNYVLAHQNMSNSLYEEQDYREAIDEALKVLEIDSLRFDFALWVKLLDEVKEVDKKKALDRLRTIIAGTQNEADLYYSWGGALFEAGRYLEADGPYQTAIRLKPDFVAAFNDWGRALHARGRYEQAIKQYAAALTIQSDYFNAEYNSGLAFVQLKQDDDAIKSYERAAAIRPTSGKPLAQLGLVFAGQKKFDEANEEFAKAAAAEPDYFWTYKHWADSLYQTGQYKDALEQSLRAVEAGPHSAGFEIILDCLEKLKDTERREFSARLNSVIAKTPSPSEVLCNWGNALLNRKGYEKAIDKFQEAIRRNAKHSEAYRNWGEALHAQERYPDARRKFETAARVAPEDVLAQISWANLLYDQQKYPEAARRYFRAIQIDPGGVDYERWISVLEKLEGDEKENLLNDLDKFLATNPAKFRAYYNWGSALFERQEYTHAITQFRKLIALKSAFVDAYNDWGLALFRQQDYEAALTVFLEATQVSDRYVYAHYNAGLIFGRWNNHAEAIRQFRKALEVNPEYAPAYAQWGSELLAEGEYKEALEKFLSAIELDPASVDYSQWVAGLQYLEIDDRDAAAKSFQNLVEPRLLLIDAYLFWGAALQSLRRYDEATEKYQALLRIDAHHFRAYYALGNVALMLKKNDEAIEKYRKAIAVKADFVDGYFNWGYALAQQKKSAEALSLYEKAMAVNPDYAYAYHNIANHFWIQGKYREGREKWELARRAYDRSRQKSKVDGDADQFQYHGGVVHDIFGELDQAEKIYREGLAIDGNHIGILTGLINLYLEKKDEDSGEDGMTAYWQARTLYDKAEELLREQLKTDSDSRIQLTLAQLYLTVEAKDRYDEAEKILIALTEGSSRMTETYANLGVLYTRREDFRKGIQNFEEAVSLEPNDLLTRSNLAEAYLKAKRYDKAEEEYNKILAIAGEHIESLIGLAQVNIALAENGDGDAFYDAIDYLTEAITLTHSRQGSKRLKKKDLAAVLYARGYALVNVYESARVLKDESYLQKAREDFRNCEKLDPSHHKAARALKKIDARLKRFTSQRVTERWGRALLIVLSVIVFLMTGTSFFFKWPTNDVDGKYCVILTFGSLLFMIAGLYLPQLLKLKVAGIELEKSTLDQITTAGTLGISK